MDLPFRMIFKKMRYVGEAIMFRHSIFSLPFAYIAAFAASEGAPKLYQLFWVTVALFGARNAANALNRVIDAEIDEKNPRTRYRHIPAGILSKKELLAFAAVCLSLLVLAAFMLNSLCVKLLPVAGFLLIFYSYTKRFTWACHLFLGLASSAAPVGSWIAVTGRIEYPALLLGAVYGLWVAGFDIIYGTLDVDFDRRNGIHSIPADFGIKKALEISLGFHVVSILLLFWFWRLIHLGYLFLAGIAIVAFLLYYEHSIVSPTDLAHAKVASYNINEVVGITLLAFFLADMLS
ncbi:MAG: putative 4-hydroxybenzoate polyprenyltransferase [Tepidanaerobacteraceae bacterium]|jgi:4-hydroxybenzoate polyprenyltransferase|nr:putative 4-hydroxybenzoate polyprenyltransferase [Tepidanaerobacteraceae bacterium]